VNLGTGGASGSTTVVNIGSATAGAGGTTVINTPTVTFANAVTEVGMPRANLTAQLLGLGGAVADSFNRLSLNTPAVLLNNAGAGIEATVGARHRARAYDGHAVPAEGPLRGHPQCDPVSGPRGGGDADAAPDARSRLGCVSTWNKYPLAG
jgi:hypothetical protein